MQSFKKKLTTLVSSGIDPVIEGKNNFDNPKEPIEELAKSRSEICAKCPLMVKEPVGFLAVKDNRIPTISKKMCDDCGCTLPYKTRQTLTTCSKWLR